MQTIKLSAIDKKILLEIKNKNGLSRADLVRELILSKSTVTASVNRLISENLVSEIRETPKKNQRGQPSLRLTFHSERYNFVGLFMSGKSITSAVCDLSANKIWISKQELIVDTLEGVKKQAIRLLETALKNVESDCYHIGISVPGIVSKDQEILEVAPRDKSIPYRRVIQYVRDYFPEYTVNVSKNSEIYIHALNAKNYHKVILYVGLEEGLSGALFDKDHIFTGGFNQGVNLGALLPETGKRPNVTDLAKFLDILPSDLTPDLLDNLWNKQDSKLLEWIDDRGSMLSRPLSATVQLFSPQEIILGGMLNKPITDALIKKIDLSYYDTENRFPVTKPSIISSDIFGEKYRPIAAAAISVIEMLY